MSHTVVDHEHPQLQPTSIHHFHRFQVQDANVSPAYLPNYSHKQPVFSSPDSWGQRANLYGCVLCLMPIPAEQTRILPLVAERSARGPGAAPLCLGC